MINEVQNSILDTIDFLVEHRMQQLQRDKTIICQVKGLVNPITNEYLVSYNQGEIRAFAKSGDVYSDNQMVYVSVPLGDFQATKYIVGLAYGEAASNSGAQKATLLLNNYSNVGANAFSKKSDKNYFGLWSSYLDENNPEIVRTSDTNVLYSRSNPEASKIRINQEDLKNSMRDAEAVFLSLRVQTDLHQIQRQAGTGEYGLLVGCSFSDRDHKNSNTPLLMMNFAMAEIEAIHEDFNRTYKEKVKAILKRLEKCDNDIVEYLNELTYLKDFSDSPIGFTQEALFECLQEVATNWHEIEKPLRTLLDEKTIDDQLFTQWYTEFLAQWNKNIENLQDIVDTKIYVYNLNSTQMTGNPLNFATPALQYQLFDVADKEFIAVEYVVAYSKDFTPTGIGLEGTKKNSRADILFSDLVFQPLKTIKAKNGEYTLRLVSDTGYTFSRAAQAEYELNDVNATLSTQAKVDKSGVNVSDKFTYYWFRRNSKITPSAEKYSLYGGSGWELLQSGLGMVNFETSIKENQAAATNYKVVAIYQDNITIAEEFDFYNENSQHKFVLDSSTGTEFTFDRGEPVLRCGEVPHGDNAKPNFTYNDAYSYVWHKVEGGSDIILNSVEELRAKKQQNEQKIYEEMKKPESERDTALVQLCIEEQKRLALEIDRVKNLSVKLSKNTLTYPIANSSYSKVVFICEVFSKIDGSYLGQASITLTNSQDLSRQSYNIIIKGGDQVFQYSELGDSPALSTNPNPIEIQSLTVSFYDESLSLVHPDEYELYWFFPPADETLIDVKKQNLQRDLVFGTDNVNMVHLDGRSSLPIKILDKYNYKRTNNTLRCVLKYKNKLYSQDTHFTFYKVGDNGTNGTPYSCKITVANDVDEFSTDVNKPAELCYLVPVNNNTGQDFLFYKAGSKVGAAKLEAHLYRNNTEVKSEIIASASRWQLLGKDSVRSLYNVNGQKEYATITPNKNYDSDKAIYNFILQAALKVNETKQIIYGAYPVPLYQSEDGSLAEIHLFADSVREITYDSNGTTPLYNTESGVHFALPGVPIEDISVYTFGGAKNDGDGKALRVLHKPDWVNQQADGSYRIYIEALETYSGEWGNQGIIIAWDDNRKQLFYPIYCHLNRNSLSSLNEWDGNSIEISKEEGKEKYILAPQIGAGHKNDDNTFTGLVMGTAKSYGTDAKGEENVASHTGLLGYTKGVRSLYLDAETGAMTLGTRNTGLQEEGFGFNEGQIKLVPGGVSTIGSWRIGNNALMSVHDPKKKVASNKDKFKTNFFRDNFMYWQEVDDNDNVLAGQYNSIGSVYRPKTSYQVAIHPNKEGIVLNSAPAYISVKGRPLHENDLTGIGTQKSVVEPGDSFEVEINPAERSIFSVYRHHYYAEGEEGAEREGWYRYPIAGINSLGQFYTTAVQDKDVSMSLGTVDAFGVKNTNRFRGVSFAANVDGRQETLLNAALDTQDDNRLVVAGNTAADKMYKRGIDVYGKDITLNAGNRMTNTADKVSATALKLGSQETSLQLDVNKFVSLTPETFNFKYSNGRTPGTSLTIDKENNLTFSFKNAKLITEQPADGSKWLSTYIDDANYYVGAIGDRGGQVYLRAKGNGMNAGTVLLKSDDGNSKQATMKLSHSNGAELSAPKLSMNLRDFIADFGGGSQAYFHVINDKEEWGITTGSAGSIKARKDSIGSQIDFITSQSVFSGNMDVKKRLVVEGDQVDASKATGYFSTVSIKSDLHYYTNYRLDYGNWGKGTAYTGLWSFLSELARSIGLLRDEMYKELRSVNGKFYNYYTKGEADKRYAPQKHWHNITVQGSSFGYWGPNWTTRDSYMIETAKPSYKYIQGSATIESSYPKY